MGKNTSVEVQMSEILDSVKNSVDDTIEKTTENAAKVTQSELRNNSPTDKGDYKKGWTIKKDRKLKSATVYNSKFPGLTHLLENGHVISNGKGEYGRAPAHKHIEPAAEKGIDACLDGVDDGLDKL